MLRPRKITSCSMVAGMRSSMVRTWRTHHKNNEDNSKHTEKFDDKKTEKLDGKNKEQNGGNNMQKDVRGGKKL